MATSRKSRRKNEGGFALLLVFLMASMIAISLYLEIPRVAMQTQRDKEETLIDRGEQYKRAIQLFVKKTNHYPAKIEDLENFQNQRFLRKRYTDPLTGKEEWRPIHINNGVLTDSKVTKPPGPGGDDKPKGPNGFVMEMAGMAAVQGQNGSAVANARDRRRASEGGVTATDPNAPAPIPAAGGLAGTNTPAGNLAQGIYPGQFNNGQVNNGQVNNGQFNNGQANFGQQGQNGNTPYPVLPLNNGTQPYPNNGMPPGVNNQQYGPVPPGMSGVPGAPGLSGFNAPNGTPGTLTNAGNGPGGSNSANSGSSFVGASNSFVGGGGSFVGGGSVTGSQPSNPSMAGNPYPGTSSLPGQPGPAANSQTFGGTPAYPTAAGSNGNPQGFPQQGIGTPGNGTGGNAAADMIRNILTTPRPGGMPTGATTGQVVGTGIAGFASKGEGEGVKVYNDRSKYEEWEFIFDPAKVKVIPNPNVTAIGGTPASQMPGASSPGLAPGTLPAGMSPVGGPPPKGQ